MPNIKYTLNPWKSKTNVSTLLSYWTINTKHTTIQLLQWSLIHNQTLSTINCEKNLGGFGPLLITYCQVFTFTLLPFSMTFSSYFNFFLEVLFKITLYRYAFYDLIGKIFKWWRMVEPVRTKIEYVIESRPPRIQLHV